MNQSVVKRLPAVLLASAAVLASFATSLFATNGTWTNLAGGSWATAVNWNNSIIATNTDGTADFSTLTLGGLRTNTLDGARTIGNLVFGDVGNTYGWTLNTGTAGPLTLATSSGMSTITVNGQTNNISAVLAGTNGVTKAGAGVLVLGGNDTYSGTTLVSAGILQIANTTGGSGGLANSAIVVTNGAELDLNASDALGYGNANPLTVSGIVKKINNQNETLYRPITLANGTFTNTLAVGTSAFEMFGGFIATAPATTNWITGPGQFGLRTSTTYFTNAPGSVLNVSAQLVPYTAGCPLNKYGSGTMVLMGGTNNNYSGNTYVYGGTLALSGLATVTNTPSIVVAPSASLDVSGLTSTFSLLASQTLVAGNTGTAVTNVNGNVSSAGTVNIAGIATNATLTVNGNLSLTGGNIFYDSGDLIALTGSSILNLSGTTTIQPTATLGDGSYTIINGISSVGSGTAANLALAGGAPRGATAAFTVAAPTVTLNISGSAPTSLTWQGTNGANWDTATTVNWNNAGTADKFYTGDYVTFDDSGKAPVTLVGLLYPGSVTVSSANTNFVFSGSGGIYGSGGLTMSGASVLTLGTANGYTGGTTINSGTVKLANANALGNGTGPLTMTGGILDLTNNNCSIQTLSGVSGVIITNTYVTATANTKTITINQVTSNTFAGLIMKSIGTTTNDIALTKNGPGYLLLTAASTFGGTVTVNAGTLEVTNIAVNGRPYTLASGATLKLAYNSPDSFGYNDGVTVNGVSAADASGLYLVGGKSLQIAANSGFTGLTLQTAPSTVRAYGSGSATLAGGDYNRTHLNVASTASGSVIAPQINITGGSYGYRMSIASGANTATGDLLFGGLFTTGSANNGVRGGQMVGVHKYGTGSLLVTNASTDTAFAGIWVEAGSMILSGGDNRLPATSGVALGDTGTTGQLILNGVAQTLTNIAVNVGAGAVLGGSASVVSTLTINNANADNYSGAIGGTGSTQNNLSLVKTGAGLLTLSGQLYYTGNTTISAGTVLASSLTNADGSLLSVPDVAGTLTATNLQLGVSSGSRVAFTSFAGAANAPIVVTNLSTKGTVYVSLAGNLTAGVQYPLIKYTSGSIGGAGFSAFQIARGMSGYLTNNTANSSVDVVLTSTNTFPLAWKGNVTTNWDVNTTANWAYNGIANVYLNNDNVQFDDTAVASSTNVTLNTTVTPTSLAFANSTLNYTIAGSGALAGSYGITKSGAAAVALQTVNTFNGGVTVTGGTLAVNSITNGGQPCALGAASNSTNSLVLNGGVLSYTGPTNTTDRAVTIGAAGGGISVTSNLTLNAVITGAGKFTKGGAGQLTLSVNAPVTGGFVVDAGTLQLTTSDFGAAFTPSLITVNTNGTLFGNHTHATGGGTGISLNRGTWLLNAEDYKQNVTMVDGLIAPGPSPNSSGGELRVGYAGGSGSYTWYVTNSVAGSVINSPLNTIASTVNLTLNVARGAAASDLTVNGQIKNGGNVIFTGNGITTFTTNNTYTGNTTINGGKLVLSGAGSIASSPTITAAGGATLDVAGVTGGFTLAGSQTLQGSGTVAGAMADVAGSIITPGGTNVVGTLHFGSDLTLAGGSDVLNFDLSKTPTSIGGTNSDTIAVAGNLTINYGTIININPWQVSLAGGTYKLITYTGTLTDNTGGTVGSGGWTLNFTPSGRITSAVLDTSTPGEIDLIVTGTPASLVWQGDGSNNYWDVNGTSDWLKGGTPDQFYQFDNVTFDNTGSATPAVNILTSVTPGSVTVNSSQHYSFNGSSIDGTTGLTKSGSGTLTILNTDNYSGVTAVNAGTLEIGDGSTADGSLPNSPITNNATVKFNVLTGQTADQPISGSGTVVQAGSTSGTLTLNNGANSWTGGLNIQSGTAKPGTNNALPAGESVTIAASGAYDFNGINNSATTTRGYSFAIAGAGPDGSSGALVNTGTGIQSYASISNLTLTADATVGGSGRFDVGPVTNSTFNGNGHALTKAGANDFDIRAQTLTNVSQINIAAGNVFFENFDQTNTWTAHTTNYLTGSAKLGIYGSQTINLPITVPAGGGGGTIDNQGSGVPVWSGAVDLEDPTTISSSSGSLAFTGTVGGSGALTLAGGNTIAFGGKCSIPVSSMTWTSGTLQLGYNNAGGSFPDPTITVPSGASFGVGRSDVYTLTNVITGAGGMSVVCTNGLVVNSSASINLGGGLYVGQGAYGKLLIQPGASITAGTFYLGNPGGISGDVVQTGGTLTVTNPASKSFVIGHWATETSTYTMGGGVISFPVGTVSVGWDGNGILNQTGGLISCAKLTVDDNGSGPLGIYSLTGGTNLIGSGGIASAGVYTIYLGGGTLGASANWSSSLNLSLTGTNGNTTVDTAANSVTLSGNLSGVGGLVKNGAGTLTLSGNDTYSGNTTVGNGTLLVSGTVAASALTVNSAGTVSGLGTLKGAVVNNGTFAPGTNGIGTLTVSNALTLNSGGATTLTINRAVGTNSFGKVAGLASVSFGGTLTVTGSGTFVLGDSFKLFSAGSYAGNFASTNLPGGLPGGTQWNWNPANGVLSVVNSGPTGPAGLTNSISGSTLTLTWPAGQNWRLVSQTNDLSTGLSGTWNTVPGVSDGSATITIDPAKPTVFYELVYP
jgi:fibronectin-binding autotransporter adhesin